MAYPSMDPFYEQRLRDEVIYLHSLWHQGPPGTVASDVVRHHLQPSKTTQFKKQKKFRGENGKKSTNKPNNAAAESNSSSGTEWPCPIPPPPPPPPPFTAGWASLEAEPIREPRRLSLEEQSKLAAKHAHQHAFKVVSKFFMRNNSDDSDAIDSGSSEDDELMEEDNGLEKYSFFKIFKEDAVLREYYEKNFAEGEFSCLVCGAVGGKKMGKKFKGCLPLVQHSITIAKTKKRRAHRALGQAVCEVLGWDIDHLPAIVSWLSDKSGETHGHSGSDKRGSSMTLVSNVDFVRDDALEVKNDEVAPESGYVGTGISFNGSEGDMVCAVRDA